MYKIFIGYDHRQPVSYHVLVQSLIDTASQPLSIQPLVRETLPVKRQGLTPFTYTRFLVPWLCDYKDWAIFLDADILLKRDIIELFEFIKNDKEPTKAVYVCETGPLFERASVMLFNNAHPACRQYFYPDAIETGKGYHSLDFLGDELGFFPTHWNRCVGYEPFGDPALIHYTQGIPYFREMQACEGAKDWWQTYKKTVSAEAWDQLMAKSVHAINLNGVFMPKYLFNFITADKVEFNPEYSSFGVKLYKEKANGNVWGNGNTGC